MLYTTNSTGRNSLKIGYDIIHFLGILIFIIGIVGNILNILVLSHKKLRSVTCIIVFLTCSITGTITLIFGLGPRILSHWHLDIRETNRWICKLSHFVLFHFRLVTFWLYMLTTIDRWLLTSYEFCRRWLSSIKNTFRSIAFIFIFSILLHIQILFCYDASCFYKNNICRLMNDFIFAIVTALTPLILISIFGWMTILNVRSSHIRSNLMRKARQKNCYLFVTKQQQRIERRDRFILRMFFIQVILFGCLILPFVICRFYITIRMNYSQTENQKDIDRFVFELALLMTFIPSGMQFYVNTLTGGYVFRKALRDTFKKIQCR